MSAKWIDVARYGAVMKILPKSPLRGCALTVLEIRNKVLFSEMFGDHTTDEFSTKQDRLAAARTALGFMASESSRYDEKTEWTFLQWASTKTKFSLEDLQGLFPGLDAEDMREMPMEDVVLQFKPDPGVAAEWQRFGDEVLANEAVDVWTPKISPFDKPYDDCQTLTSVIFGAQGGGQLGHRLVHGNALAPTRISSVLSDAHFRENALVAYYADILSAMNDGFAPDELQPTTFPHALPLTISEGGRVIALRDLRFAPEIMDVGPDEGYGICKKGLIITALRASEPVATLLKVELSKWMQWYEKPETLTDAAEIERSLRVIVDAAQVMKDAYPRVKFIARSLTVLAVDQPANALVKLLRPLVEMDSGHMENVAKTFRQFGATDMSTEGLTLMANTVLAHGKLRMVEQVKELAQTQLADVAAAMRIKASDDTVDGKVKHVDAGQKIGGARKDFAKRAMIVDDIGSMNDQERDALIVKKNVWPALDYASMREQGVSVFAATAIKYLKDSLNCAPDRRRHNHPDAETGYIQAIECVRDRLQVVKTLENFSDAMVALYKMGTEQATSGERTRSIYGHTQTQVQWGQDACRLIWEGDNNGHGCVPSKIFREIRRKVGDDPSNWTSLIKESKKKTDEELDEDRDKADTDRELHRPHLDHVQRHGEDWRQGRDIVAEDLIEHFGFRAVEFGTWLPQDERGTVLNSAFDAFCDLAQALDIPPASVSLNGELAVAFGSRGRGGKNAALAHYEPSRVVINLTRMKGAGTLAHEWMHALDYHLGKGTSAVQGAKRGTVMGQLHIAIHHKSVDQDTLYDKTWANASRGKDNISSWLYLQPAHTRPLLKEITEALFQKATDHFQDIADAAYPSVVMTSHMPAHGLVPRDTQSSVAYDFVKDLKKACENAPGFTKVKGKIDSNLNYALFNLSIASTVQAAKKANGQLPASFLGEGNAVSTDFVLNAKKLDTTRSTPYWSTPLELFARAGASYVHHRLETLGVRSDYLVFGADEQRYLDHPVGNPNPAGVDREALAPHFDAIITEYRLQHMARQEQNNAAAFTVA